MISTFAIISSLIASLAASPKPASPAAKPHALAPMVVVVQNPRNVPVAIYMESGWAQYKIGVVGAHADSLLTVPSDLLQNLSHNVVRFYVHATGENEDATQYIEARPGGQIGLIVTRY